jgi:predicted RNA-binding Zn ribbon-like protein
MRAVEKSVGDLKLLGGRLCLDFVNTLDPREGERARDFLTSYSDLISWGVHVGILGSGEARRMSRSAARDPAGASTVFTKAVALREATYRLFSAVIIGRRPRATDLNVLQAALDEAPPRSRIVLTKKGFGWHPVGGSDTLERVLWPVAWSAADLLTSDDLPSVKKCTGQYCGWLFLDMSRNNNRQWCSMKGCGNREKARRHYGRVRDDASTSLADFRS